MYSLQQHKKVKAQLLNPMTMPIPKYCENCRSHPSEFLENHLKKYTYIWLKTGKSFWFFPTELNQRIIRGYIWNGESWVLYWFSFQMIDSFY